MKKLVSDSLLNVNNSKLLLPIHVTIVVIMRGIVGGTPVSNLSLSYTFSNRFHMDYHVGIDINIDINIDIDPPSSKGQLQ